MTQHTYDNEAVQELLNWAKKMIETKNYPTERYQVNQCTTIIDGKSYLESLIAMISRNWENPKNWQRFYKLCYQQRTISRFFMFI